eukprot:TRINITY_DN5653_c0_g1_i4.p2 TRINITY_DN5653_c0_g1~~TRINITY_DN5653_c0_g1_i4.p2  ORF type:complete len:161 (+),score=27.26 TRINITY_DN5653_c0_g1_i4:57-539(+)
MARTAGRSSVAAALLLAAGTIALAPAFCGGLFGAPAKVQYRTPSQGWRLDKIEVGPGGIGQLVTAEGYFIGEKDFARILNAQGRRYRMRPTARLGDFDKPDAPGLFQLGPVKMRLLEIFRGSCGEVTYDREYKRPAGYSGAGGVAGWEDELPQKKLGYGY